MKLTAEQLRDFDEQGYIFMPSCFSEQEVALLASEAEDILKADRKEVWREKTGAPRTAFAAHTYNEAFRLMAQRSCDAAPRALGCGDPIRTILNCRITMPARR